jgi:acetyl-CoA carboxylase carboxyltransferase component
MPALRDTLDRRRPEHDSNREAMLAHLGDARRAARDRARRLEKSVARHRKRGKLLPRERIELLVDRDAPFLELSPLAAYGSSFPLGAQRRHRHRRRGGRRVHARRERPHRPRRRDQPGDGEEGRPGDGDRRENRLPLVNLVESGGADLPTQAEIFIPGGAMFRNLTQFSAAGIPTIALVFGNSTPAARTCPACATTS